MYSKPIAIILTVLFVFLYYFLFYNILEYSSGTGVILVTTPIYLIYALVVTSAILLYISVYTIRLSVFNIVNNIPSGVSVVTAVAGGVIASCECQIPLLSVVLYSLGFNSLSVSNVLSFVGAYQTVIITLLFLLNLIFIYYSLGRLSSTCRIKNGRIIPNDKATSKKK